MMGGVIRGCGALCHQYADDTQLYISFSPTAGDAVLSLQCCRTEMDAGEWAEAEPGQDGGTEGGFSHSWGFGKLPLLWGG